MAHFYAQLAQKQKLINASKVTNTPSKFDMKFMTALFFRKYGYLAALIVVVCCHALVTTKVTNILGISQEIVTP